MKYIISMILVLLVAVLVFGSDLEDSSGKKIADKLMSFGLNPYFVILIIAMLPIVELRGSIPVGILLFDLNIFYVILFSVIGNIIPIFFILYLFDFFEKIFRKIKIFDIFFDWLFARTMAKSERIKKFEEFGLMIYVAIPAPVTGAWTGSLISYLLKFKYKRSIIFIILGVLIACIIVTTITLLIKNGIQLFYN